MPRKKAAKTQSKPVEQPSEEVKQEEQPSSANETEQ